MVRYEDQLSFTIQPNFLRKLIIEDIVPGTYEPAQSTFPVYFNAMKNAHFDQTAQSVGQVRKNIDAQLQEAMPVNDSVLQYSCFDMSLNVVTFLHRIRHFAASF